jgi:hypothetical protein
MTDLPYGIGSAENSLSQPRAHFGPAFLIYSHIIACCVSLALVSQIYHYAHIWFDENGLYNAIVVIAAFALVSIFFTFARFSFGYFVGFYFYTMIVGFLWLVCFTKFDYDHQLAGVSAAVSAITFLIPALFITSPVRQSYALSIQALERLLSFILILGAATIVIGAVYNFRLVALEDIYHFRNELEFPTILSYLIGIVSNALLPFAFACYVVRKDRWRAGITLLLLLLFYPVTLSKLAFFSPIWLLIISLMSRYFAARTTVVLSLFLPMLAGIIFITAGEEAYYYFGTINYRMIAIPSSALDHYNDFFSTHDLTYFCQISFLKPIVDCPYGEPLSILMAKVYGVGNFNASVFATEGIASVGLLLAPVILFLCGLVIALGNRISSNLPPRFVLMSGAIFPQTFLNVPFSTVLLTNGAAMLFLLWYLTPRTIFEQK